MSAFDDLDELAPRRIWERVAVRIVHGERISLGVVELEPDSLVPEHDHENEQVGLVLAGGLVFTIGGERRELAPGGIYRIPAGTPHSVETGPDGAVVVDVFSPVREEWKALERAQPAPPRWPRG